MKNRLILAALLALLAWTGAAHASDAIEWRVSAQFPQERERMPNGESRWRTPRPRDGGQFLPEQGQTWEAWYAALGARGQSPYADFIGTQRDVWLERLQRYDPGFLAYAQSDRVFVRLSAAPSLSLARCRWEIAGQPQRTWLGCRDVEASIPTAGAEVTLYDGSRRIASTVVKPERLVVLGLGDSYAAGEGNPDLPTEWNRVPVLDPATDPLAPERLAWLDLSAATPNPYVRADAQWRDHACHRSFWNQQTYTAMQLAANDPRREVVFLHFACSGAEILDGMLVRQLNPPGISTTSKSGCTAGRSPDCRLKASQLAAAVSALCLDRPDADDVRRLGRGDAGFDALNAAIKPHFNGRDRWQKLSAYREGKRADAPYGLDLAACQSTLRQPDLVLLSLGGNDAGFANLVAWAVLPSAGRTRLTGRLLDVARAYSVICPKGAKGRGCRKPHADGYAEQLEGRFALFARALRDTGLVADPRRVVVSSYPDPLRTATPGPEGQPLLCADTGAATPWESLNVSLPRTARHWGNWTFALRNEGSEYNARAASTLYDSVLPTLRRHLQRAAQDNGFTFVPAVADAFVGHSWCDEAPGEQQRLALPSNDASHWPDRSPWHWRPYAPRARAIRTANDSYLTQLSIRSGDRNGSMHPTAEGHMLIAERVYARAAEVLGEPGLLLPAASSTR